MSPAVPRGLGYAPDGRDGVERPVEAVPGADVLGERQADHPEHQQADDRRTETAHPPEELDHLRPRAQAGRPEPQGPRLADPRLGRNARRPVSRFVDHQWWYGSPAMILCAR